MTPRPDSPSHPPLRQRLTAVFGRMGRRLFSGWTGRLVSALFLLITLGIVAQILLNNWDTLATFQWQLRPVWLLAILLFFLIDLLVATWAWHLLVAALANYHNFRRSAKICWYSNLARRIPTPVWYIAGRAVMYEQVGVSKLTISLLSTLELIFFFLSGLVTTLLTLPFWVIPPQLRAGTTQVWLLLPLLLLSLLLVHPRVLETLWRRLRPGAALQPLRWQTTITWLGYYMLAWVFGALVMYSAINLLTPLPLSKLIPVIGIWSLAGSISLAGSLTISLIGVREISLTLLLATLIPAPVALIVAILMRLIWLTGETLSALASLKL